MNNVYNPNAMNIRSPAPNVTANPLMQQQVAYNNEFLYNGNNNGYYNNPPNHDQFFKCRPVSSKAEASAFSIDLNGSLWVFVDLGHGKIYTKQIKENGQSDFKVYVSFFVTASWVSPEVTIAYPSMGVISNEKKPGSSRVTSKDAFSITNSLAFRMQTVGITGRLLFIPEMFLHSEDESESASATVPFSNSFSSAP